MRALRCAAVLGLYFGYIHNLGMADMVSYREAVEDTPGLVDYYTFEDDNGNDTTDGGNGFNDGTAAPENTPIFEDGVNGDGRAARFDGIDLALISIAPAIGVPKSDRG